MTPEEFMELSGEQVLSLRQQAELAIERRAAFQSSLYTHFVQGSDKLKYYAGDSCEIHKDTLATSYSRNATAAHYKEMNDNVAFARAIGEGLFDRTIGVTSTSQYSYGLWGDWYPSVGGVHQGIEYTIKQGAPVYTVARGTVVSTEEYAGGTTVVIENSNYGLYYIYMHLQNPTVEVGEYIYEGEQIGEQGRYETSKESNTHLHFEVSDKKVTQGHPNTTNTIYSVNPYFAGLYFIG